MSKSSFSKRQIEILISLYGRKLGTDSLHVESLATSVRVHHTDKLRLKILRDLQGEGLCVEKKTQIDGSVFVFERSTTGTF